MERDLAGQIVRFIQRVRQQDLSKPPGIAETLDWAAALLSLGKQSLTSEAVEETIGCILKSNEDITRVQNEGIAAILSL